MTVFFSAKRMTGGLVFGAPAWMPERIETTFSAGVPEKGAEPAPASETPSPTDRDGLLNLLDKIHLGATTPTVPALADQIRGLAAAGDGRGGRALILSLLPSQPEYVLGPALSRLAMAELIAGMQLLHAVLKPARTLIVLDRQDRQTRKLWKRAIRAAGLKKQIRMAPLLNRYPHGHPSILFRSLLGLRLQVGELPSVAGAVLVDPVSAWALGRYLRSGEVFTERPVQFFEQGSAGPRLVMGRIGESLLEFCRRNRAESPLILGNAGRPPQVIFNGMLAGEWVDAASARISGMVEALSIRPCADIEFPTPCIACGWCVDVCPSGLTPVHLLELSQRAGAGRGADAIPSPGFMPRAQMAEEARHCIACGLCTYVCPSRLPLTEQIVRLRERVAGGSCGGEAP